MKRIISLLKHSSISSKTDTSITDEATPASSSPRQSSHERSCHELSRLENLPAEIRRHTLSMLDLPSLEALVHASPVFHQQYISERRYVLCNSLEQTLGNAVLDAYVLNSCYDIMKQAIKNRAGELPGVDKIYNDTAKQLDRQHYHVWITQNEATQMARFYLRLVKPVLDHFIQSMWDELTELTTDDHQGDIPQLPQLSHTEMLRFTRAAYRYQIICQVAGRQASDMRWIAHAKHDGEGQVTALFNLLEPWEVEEILCFYQFAQRECSLAVSKVVWDLHQDNPRFDDQHRPPTPDGAFDLSNSMYMEQHIEGAALCGLPLLHILLFELEQQDHEILVTTMQKYLYSSYIPLSPSEGILGSSSQYLRREHEPSERDRLQDTQAPLPFKGDSTAEHSLRSLPPLSWTLIWGGTYCNLYGFCIPDTLRRWGFAYWDASTLTSIGGEKLVMRQWEQEWDDYDPRAEFFQY